MRIAPLLLAVLALSAASAGCFSAGLTDEARRIPVPDGWTTSQITTPTFALSGGSATLRYHYSAGYQATSVAESHAYLLREAGWRVPIVAPGDDTARYAATIEDRTLTCEVTRGIDAAGTPGLTLACELRRA